jgi:hypothetical protein
MGSSNDGPSNPQKAETRLVTRRPQHPGDHYHLLAEGIRLLRVCVGPDDVFWRCAAPARPRFGSRSIIAPASKWRAGSLAAPKSGQSCIRHLKAIPGMHLAARLHRRLRPVQRCVEARLQPSAALDCSRPPRHPGVLPCPIGPCGRSSSPDAATGFLRAAANHPFTMTVNPAVQSTKTFTPQVPLYL